jgi:hypothetical protein
LTKASWARFPRGTWRLRRTSSLAGGFSWMNGLVNWCCALLCIADLRQLLLKLCAILNMGA